MIRTKHSESWDLRYRTMDCELITLKYKKQQQILVDFSLGMTTEFPPM